MSVSYEEMDGPWEQAFWLRADLDLRSKSNFRRSTRATPTRGRTSQWDSFRRFEDDLRLLLRTARPVTWEIGDADVPVARRPAVVAVVCAASLLDVPNYPKSVMDAAEGVVFHTDASVAFSGNLGERVRRSGLIVAFARLAPSPSLTTVAAAAAALTLQTAALFSASDEPTKP
jgi:hypothetical protein